MATTLDSMRFSLILLLVLSFHLVSSQISPSPSPSPCPESEIKSPQSPSPSPVNPPSDSPDSAPAPSPSDDFVSDSPPSPALAPDGEAADLSHESVTPEKTGSKSGGTSAGKKAGLVIGVMVGAGVVGLAGFVYKRRQENMRNERETWATSSRIGLADMFLMAASSPFPLSLAVLILLQHVSSGPKGFSIKLIHRDPPLYPSDISIEERLSRLLKVGIGSFAVVWFFLVFFLSLQILLSISPLLSHLLFSFFFWITNPSLMAGLRYSKLKSSNFELLPTLLLYFNLNTTKTDSRRRIRILYRQDLEAPESSPLVCTLGRRPEKQLFSRRSNSPSLEHFFAVASLPGLAVERMDRTEVWSYRFITASPLCCQVRVTSLGHYRLLPTGKLETCFGGSLRGVSVTRFGLPLTTPHSLWIKSRLPTLLQAIFERAQLSAMVPEKACCC